MKRLITICLVFGMILAISGLARANSDLFNDGDRMTIAVRTDTADDYTYLSVSGGDPMYAGLRYTHGGATPDTGWKSVKLPFAANNRDGTPFDVCRDYMETMRFYIGTKDSMYTDLEDLHYQVDNVKLTKEAGGELLIDDFSGALKWSYQQHPAPSSPPASVNVSIVAGALDIAITDIDAITLEGPDWVNNYIDIFTCTTADATDSFIYGDDWSEYDYLEFEWQILAEGTNHTRRDYVDLYVRTDVPEPATIALLGLGALSLLRRRKV